MSFGFSVLYSHGESVDWLAGWLVGSERRDDEWNEQSPVEPRGDQAAFAGCDAIAAEYISEPGG